MSKKRTPKITPGGRAVDLAPGCRPFASCANVITDQAKSHGALAKRSPDSASIFARRAARSVASGSLPNQTGTRHS
jgi:hypothetical protein